MTCMNYTTVVNIKTDPYDVYIGRRSPFGNPYRIGIDGDRVTVIEKYALYFEQRVEADTEFRKKVVNLTGKRLGCHCAPLPCHSDVIVEWLGK